MEVNTKEANNPIVQDKVKKTGAPRFYHTAIPWNYGCIPQTYEDPDRVDAITGLKGSYSPAYHHHHHHHHSS